MAASVVQTIKPRTNAVTTASATFTATPTAGNAIVSFSVGWAAYCATTDNKSNAYTVRRSALTGNSFLRVETAQNITSSATFTCTITNSEADSKNAVISEIAGVTATPVDVIPTATTGTSTAPAISSGTLAQADEIVMGGAAPSTGAGITEPGSPWVLLGEEEDHPNYLTLNAARNIVSSTASVTATWTLGGSAAWACVMVSLKATVVAASTPVSLSASPPIRITQVFIGY